MAKSHKYIIVVNFPKKVLDKIESFRKIFYSSRTKRIKSHLTIKYDEYLLITQEELNKKLIEFGKKYPPLRLQIGRVRTNKSKKGWNIYLPVLNKELPEIVKVISNLLYPYIDKDKPGAFESSKWEQSDGFYAHISIKGGSGQKELEQILNKLQNKEISFDREVICKTFSLYRWNKDRWKKVSTHSFLG